MLSLALAWPRCCMRRIFIGCDAVDYSGYPDAAAYIDALRDGQSRHEVGDRGITFASTCTLAASIQSGDHQAGNALVSIMR